MRPRFTLTLIVLALFGCTKQEMITPPNSDRLKVALEAKVLDEIRSATRLVERHGREPSHWLKLGWLYENHAVHDLAEDVYLKAAQVVPKDPKFPYRAAVVASKMHEIERALKSIKVALSLAPDYGPAWCRQGYWFLEAGRFAEAQESLHRAAELMPRAPDVQAGFARLALLEDDLPKALGRAKRGLELSPNDPYLRQLLGTALRRLGKSSEALAHLQAGQGASPRFTDPWSGEGSSLHPQGARLHEQAQRLEGAARWEEAISLYRRVLKGRPDDIHLVIRVGVCLSNAARHGQAIEHFESVLTRFPGQYDLSIAYASSLRSAGRVGEALDVINRLVLRWPNRAPAFVAKGNILRAKQDVDGALASFRAATRLNPSDLRGRYFEAKLLGNLGCWVEAEATMRAGLSSSTPPSKLYHEFLLLTQTKSGVSSQSLQTTLRKNGRPR